MGNGEGDRKEDVDFFEVEVWDKQAENCNEYLSKGRGILVEGRLRQDRWEDESGNKRSKLKIVASSVQFLPRRLDNEQTLLQNLGKDPRCSHYFDDLTARSRTFSDPNYAA